VDPLPSSWPIEDHQALLLIRRLHPIPIEIVATTFFTKRSVDGVRSQWKVFMDMFQEWDQTNDDLLLQCAEKDRMTFYGIAGDMFGYEWWQLEVIWTQLIDRRREREEELLNRGDRKSG
jgi:hypothetical protein